MKTLTDAQMAKVTGGVRPEPEGVPVIPARQPIGRPSRSELDMQWENLMQQMGWGDPTNPYGPNQPWPEGTNPHAEHNHEDEQQRRAQNEEVPDEITAEDYNPNEVELGNETLREMLADLLGNLRAVDEDGQMEVSGGDREFDDEGNIVSSTDGEIIENSAPNSRHLDGRAADVVVTGDITFEQFEQAARDAGFEGVIDEGDHYHVHYGPPYSPPAGENQ